ncbi:hypothetical protein [Nocardiopsis flavescens]|uniref:hypothetical protein n=1 Tax=Nocardiopsis flavescens TaxID=758803 RepID=UPI001C49F715|nr:hypothetical protein [Nocardiopsis flavescens]
MNDAVKGFLPGNDHDAQRFFESPALRVDVASPQYLLAMKLLAARVETDADDIRFLYGKCGFTTVSEGLELLQRAYPGRQIQVKTQYLLEEIVETLTD